MKIKVIWGGIFLLLVVLVLIVSDGEWRQSSKSEMKKVSLRLMWYHQAQFAGYIVAKEKGFYREAGLEVEIRPAGPDLYPHVTVANGTDDFGVGVPNQIILARSNGVPLKILAQVFQDSANRYVLKSSNKIDSLADLKGKKVGLWLGGDEAEFVSMLNSEGLTVKDVQVVPQGYSVIPFLEDEYTLSQVTIYNELQQIIASGIEKEELQVLSPKEYGSAILSDLLFTSEQVIHKSPDTVNKFTEASLRGWVYVANNPDEALEIILKKYPQLERSIQQSQLLEVVKLLGNVDELGEMNLDDYENTIRILVLSGQLRNPISSRDLILAN